MYVICRPKSVAPVADSWWGSDDWNVPGDKQTKLRDMIEAAERQLDPIGGNLSTRSDSTYKVDGGVQRTDSVR